MLDDTTSVHVEMKVLKLGEEDLHWLSVAGATVRMLHIHRAALDEYHWQIYVVMGGSCYLLPKATIRSYEVTV
jgi:hypothetical protein